MLLCGCLLFLAGGAHAAEINWAKSFHAAIQQAKTTGRPVMVDFYTDWCGWCKKLDSDVYTNSQVVQTAGKFVSVKVNAEREGVEQARKYQVRSFPTILFLNGAGDVVGMIKGYLPADRFNAEMQQVLTMHRELPALKTRFQSSPNDAAAASKLASFYAKQGNASGAANAYARVQKLDPTGAKGYLSAAAASLGDMYQSRRAYNESIPYYQTAARTGKTVPIVRKGYIGQTISCLMADRISEAKAVLKANVADRRLTEQDHQEAKAMLGRIEAMQKEGKLQGK
jgi:thiol-disulfide isomerase/thioredoxin